jgi:hypothetical protein
MLLWPPRRRADLQREAAGALRAVADLVDADPGQCGERARLAREAVDALGRRLRGTQHRPTGLQHGFWVVLGTLSVLRSNALGTGRSILSALAGTAVGILAGALLPPVSNRGRPPLAVMARPCVCAGAISSRP